MLYQTLNQPIICIVIFLAGFMSGFIFDLFNLFKLSLNKIKGVSIFFDFLSVFLSFFVYFIVNLYINFGQFRFYVVLLFLLGLCLQRGTSTIFMTILKNIHLKNKK